MKAKLGGVWLIAAALVSTAVPSAVAEDRTPTAISDIRQENTDRSTRVIIECTGPLAYTYYSPDPLTLVVDIPEVDASKVPARINVATREVESLRVTNLARADGRNIARLEVRLASLVPYQIYSKGKALNLVFDRPAAAAAAPVVPVAVAQAQVAAPEPPPAARIAPPTAEPPAAPTEAHSVAPAPMPQAPPPAPSAEVKSSAPKATRIVSVQPEDQDGQLAVTVKADGRLRYQDFFLGNPDRLVVDFPDVVTRASARPIEVNQGPLRKVRIGQFSAASPKVARLVLDLSARTPYRIVEGSDGLKVVFGEGREPAPAPLAALREPEDASAPVLETSAPVAAAQVYSPRGGASLSMPVLPEPQLASSTRVEDTGNLGGSGTKFTGTPITLDFKDGDLQDIFRLFADISGLNVVVNPGVSGKVTLKLTEVPWDQALDLILKTNGLGYTLEDNVIRIAKLTDLQKEEQDRRKLEEEKALAGTLADYTKRISYAKAATISDVIKKAGALSARGQINVDERTNTMIMRDLPSYIEKAKGLVAELDRATPQVEIEARIVITSRNFTRDLGIQWGFNQENSPRYGNTTNRNFPNAIVINGGGLGSTGSTGDQAADAGIGVGGSRLRGQPAGQRGQQRNRHRDGQHPGQLQPRPRPDGPRAPGARTAAFDAEGDDPEQHGRGDQAGRPDPHPDGREQHRHRAVQGRRADPQGHPADHRRGNGHPEPRGREQLGGFREPRQWNSPDQHAVGQDHRPRAGRVHGGGGRDLPEQRADLPEFDALPGQDTDPRLFVPQPLHDQYQQRAVAVHHASDRQAGVEAMWSPDPSQGTTAVPWRRVMKVIPVLVLGGLVVAGCSPSYFEQGDSTRALLLTGVNGGNVLESDLRQSTNLCPDSVPVRVENHAKNPNAPVAGFRDDIVVERYEVRYFRSDGRGVEGVDVPYSISGNLAFEIQGEAGRPTSTSRS